MPVTATENKVLTIPSLEKRTGLPQWRLRRVLDAKLPGQRVGLLRFWTLDQLPTILEILRAAGCEIKEPM